ncbi:MAG: hypothetical protein ACK4ZJ_18515, partial [Allorhizobium sp.]
IRTHPIAAVPTKTALCTHMHKSPEGAVSAEIRASSAMSDSRDLLDRLCKLFSSPGGRDLLLKVLSYSMSYIVGTPLARCRMRAIA